MWQDELIVMEYRALKMLLFPWIKTRNKSTKAYIITNVLKIKRFSSV